MVRNDVTKQTNLFSRPRPLSIVPGWTNGDPTRLLYPTDSEGKAWLEALIIVYSPFALFAGNVCGEGKLRCYIFWAGRFLPVLVTVCVACVLATVRNCCSSTSLRALLEWQLSHSFVQRLRFVAILFVRISSRLGSQSSQSTSAV